MQLSGLVSSLLIVLFAVLGTAVAQAAAAAAADVGPFEASMMAKRLRGEPIRFGKRSPREPIRFGKRFNPLPDYDFQ